MEDRPATSTFLVHDAKLFDPATVSSPVKNSAERYDETRSTASQAPTICAPMHIAFTSSCSTL
jgi:hypothetical protein